MAAWIWLGSRVVVEVKTVGGDEEVSRVGWVGRTQAASIQASAIIKNIGLLIFKFLLRAS